MFDNLAQRIQEYKEKGLLRQREILHNVMDLAMVRDEKGSEFLSFISNDYLGFSRHPRIGKAVAKAAIDHGYGSTGSALLGGYNPLTEELEERACELFGYKASVAVGSGFLANLAVSTALLGNRFTHTNAGGSMPKIYIDHNVHASILDGVLLARGEIIRYRHNDIDALLARLDGERGSSLVYTEGLFSMDGDVPDLDKLSKLDPSKAFVVVDEAHSVGIFGHQGRGAINEFMSKKPPMMVVPMGKAIGGYGAMILGSKASIQAIVQFGRSYIYSTALPLPCIAGNIRALELLPVLEEERIKLFASISYIRAALEHDNWKILGHKRSPIQVIEMPDNNTLMRTHRFLKQKGVLVSAIRQPTAATPRLRISLRSSHNSMHIDRLVGLLSKSRITSIVL